jgi:GH15 family glucan-1,4-alpha-glucosidase
MNTRLLFAALAVLCSISSTLPAQTVLLPERWLLKTGDDSSYKSVDLNDRSWTRVHVPSNWEREGFDNYDGFAWYRVHFSVEKQFVGKPMILRLGRIDDCDETFLNGVKVGGMGSFPPNAATAYTEQRSYHIPPGLLKQDNVLAVRVLDLMGPGGMVEGPIGLYTKRDFENETTPSSGIAHSWDRLTTSNGLIAAVVNSRRGNVEFASPHIFQAYDSAQFVRPFVLRVRPSLEGAPRSVAYAANTHIIAVSYPHVEVSYFAPFTTKHKVLVVCVSGKARDLRSVGCVWEESGTRIEVDSASFTRSDGHVRKYYLFGFIDQYHPASDVAKAKLQLQYHKGNLLDEERLWMRRRIAGANFPRRISEKERAAYEQSISVLLMAQVADEEVFPKSHGQILAALPPGEWNITWVRDGFYSILALNRLGFFTEARKALMFMLDAESSRYVSYLHSDGKHYGIGVPYQISVTRYFGKGIEESDFNDNGPNIEIDGFGLFLSALADYVTASGDTTILSQRRTQIETRVADAIVHCIDSSDVIRPDSGPWERHLPGKHFAYTSIACASGLRDFAALCGKFGFAEHGKYASSAERISRGIEKVFLVDGRLLKGNLESTDSAKYDYYDQGTIEAFTLGVVRSPEIFRTHMQAYEKALRIPGQERGFSRISAGDTYDTSEWIMLDLRTAAAYKRFGNRAAAKALLDVVTEQASRNYNLIPELLDRKAGRYAGSIPMVGFGAGVYIRTLWDLNN